MLCTTCARFGRAGPLVRETGETKWAFFWLVVLLFANPGCASFGDMLVLNIGGGVARVVSARPTWCCAHLHGVLHAGLGEGFGGCGDASVTPKVVLFAPCFFGENYVFLVECGFMVLHAAKYTGGR